MRKSPREAIVEQARERERRIAAATRPANLDLDGLLALLLGGPPNPTQRAFILDNSPLRALKGNAGSAKTSTLLTTLIIRALTHPDYRGVMGRYDYNKITDTVVPAAEAMVDRLPPGILLDRDKTPPMKWWLRCLSVDPITGEGFDAYPSMITFMGLKDYPGGVQIHAYAIDEADEVDERTVTGFYSRRREFRKPPPGAPPVPFEGLLAFNPPDKLHWLYEACTGLRHDGRKAERPAYIKLFEPGSRENEHNLRPGYYDDLATKLSADQRDRFVNNEWGATFAGQPVYREFNPRFHGRHLDPIPDAPLLRFWDFGYRRPACLWAQLDAEGRLLILRELNGENEEITPFIRRVKSIEQLYFMGCSRERVDFGDPAASQKKDTGSTLTVLKSEGVNLRFLRADILPGVRRVRLLMEQVIRGEPSFQIDTRYCSILVRALQGGYRLEDARETSRTADMGLMPVKDGTYDHVADALRYGVTNLFGVDGRATGMNSYVRAGESAARVLGPDGLPASLEYDPRLDMD